MTYSSPLRPERPAISSISLRRVEPVTDEASGPIPVLVVQPWGSQNRCQETLALWGFRSACTADVEEALRMMAEHECRALIVDLDIPKVDSLALVTALRAFERTRGVAIIATTGGGDEAVDELALQSGCDVVITGPFDPDAVAAELEAALAHPGRRCAVA